MIIYRCCECGEECGTTEITEVDVSEAWGARVVQDVRYEVSDCCEDDFDEEIVSGTDSLSETARLRVNREMEEE